jgi:phosphatidylinositol-binding clathrin assembly protein
VIGGSFAHVAPLAPPQVVFKALIVLHTMIRNGATDNVLGYLSSSEVLRLGNVSAGNWEGKDAWLLKFFFCLADSRCSCRFLLFSVTLGYNTPQNVQRYAIYLDTRIRSYRDLKHDVVQVQAESNRDFRMSMALIEDGMQSPKSKESPAGVNRSQTVAGRKLKSMTVEKGLLRETKTVQKMIDTLVECRVRFFFLSFFLFCCCGGCLSVVCSFISTI